MTDPAVVGDRVALNVGFHVARTRLRILAKGGLLLQASESVACELSHPAGMAGPSGHSPVPDHGGQP